jgi:hypothetical protein
VALVEAAEVAGYRADVLLQLHKKALLKVGAALV